MVAKSTAIDDIHYRQAISPLFAKASHSSTKTTDDAIFATRGKAKIAVYVENPSNKAAAITVYGAQTSASSVGGLTVKKLDNSTFSVGTSASDYRIAADPFPFYIVRSVTTAAPDEPIIKHFNAMN